MDTHGLSAVLDQIFSNIKKSPEFDSWNRDDWICFECLEKFIRENLHLWLLQKQQRGVSSLSYESIDTGSHVLP
jgi:hypothetical protein